MLKKKHSLSFRSNPTTAETAGPAKPAHLSPSDLGTKAYWDDTYEKEFHNFKSNPKDQGTIWFADAGAEEKIVEYLDRLASDGVLAKTQGSGSSAATSFLDLGTGNGHLLFALRDDGWEGHMLGVDYSIRSINLAREISLRRVEGHYKTFLEDGFNLGSDMQPVRFEVCDATKPRPTAGMLARGFDVLLDKGTFDAVSLSREVDDSGKRIPESYPDKIKPLLRTGGLLIVASCNWTEDELESWFTKHADPKNGAFVLRDKIKYKKFSFGGKSGQSVVTLCFEKKQ